MIEALTSKHISHQKMIGDLQVLDSKLPKELGYTLGTGHPEDHIKVDDGLREIFFLPLELCSTLEVK